MQEESNSFRFFNMEASRGSNTNDVIDRVFGVYDGGDKTSRANQRLEKIRKIHRRRNYGIRDKKETNNNANMEQQQDIVSSEEFSDTEKTPQARFMEFISTPPGSPPSFNNLTGEKMDDEIYRKFNLSAFRNVFCISKDTLNIDSDEEELDDDQTRTAFVKSNKFLNKAARIEYGLDWLVEEIASTPGSKPRNDLTNLSPPLNQLLADNNPFIGNKYDKTLKDFVTTSPSKSYQIMPAEVQCQILKGVVCYVDCCNGELNITNVVQEKMLSLGASVEQIFNEKVTHVVFKEGRVSVYIQAFRQRIPIVGVLWIEECMKFRTTVDPSFFPPRNLEIYKREYHYQMKKRRQIFLRNYVSKILKVSNQKRLINLRNYKSRVNKARKRMRMIVSDEKAETSVESTNDNTAVEDMMAPNEQDMPKPKFDANILHPSNELYPTDPK